MRAASPVTQAANIFADIFEAMIAQRSAFGATLSIATASNISARDLQWMVIACHSCVCIITRVGQIMNYRDIWRILPRPLFGICNCLQPQTRLRKMDYMSGHLPDQHSGQRFRCQYNSGSSYKTILHILAYYIVHQPLRIHSLPYPCMCCSQARSRPGRYRSPRRCSPRHTPACRLHRWLFPHSRWCCRWQPKAHSYMDLLKHH